MIQANELRMGNLVYKSLKSGQGRTVINPIGCQDIVRIFEDIGSFNYAPIPLTEDILIKCGFEHGVIERSLSIELGNDTILYDDLSCDRMYIMQEMEGERPDCMSIPQDIKYLHQLQNLYFALTQKELTIKL